MPTQMKNYFPSPFLGFLTAAVLLPGCGAETAPSAEKPALYEVQATGCGPVARVATGFAVTTERVITAAHTLRGATSITVNKSLATLVWLDHRTDIAVLQLPVPVPAQASRSVVQVRFDQPSTGPAVLLRARNGQSTTTVEITKLAPINIEEPIDKTTYRRAGFVAELSAGTIAVGDSGSAIVNENNGVVGMVFATDKSSVRRFYAVTSAELAAALAGAGSRSISSGPCDN